MKSLAKQQVFYMVLSIACMLVGIVYLASSSLPYPDPTPLLRRHQWIQYKRANVMILLGLTSFFFMLPRFVSINVIDYKTRFITIYYGILAVCTSVSFYCIINGQSKIPKHFQLHCSFMALQIFLSIIFTIGVACFKPTRKVIKWYLIPLILVVFSFYYSFVVNQIPCCISGF